MATIALPSIAPSAERTPTQQITPPAGAFGLQAAGSIGEDFAKAADQTSDSLASHALAFQAVNNKQAADEASINIAQKIDGMQTDYHANNMGMAAYNNLPKFYQDIEDARKQGAEGLTPAAAQEYNSTTRRYASAALTNTSTFAAAQRKTAVVGTSQAKIKTAQAMMVASPDDPDVQAQGLATIGQENAFQSRPDVLGLGPEQSQAQLRENVGAVYQGQIKGAVDSGDYPKAQAIYNANKDNMTLEQQVAVQGSMKVGQNAFIANSERMAWMNGSSSAAPSAAIPNPTGKWDAGTKAITPDPQGTIGALAGVPVRITSGARSVGANAAVGGSPTSEHIGGNAWDFVPSKGTLDQAAAQLASNLHAQNIPFDQIEVDKANGHVHVGFGPKNRNELIDQNGQHLASSTGANPTAGFAKPALTPTSDPDQYIAQSDAAIQHYVDTKYASNPTLGTAVFNSMHSGMMIEVQQLRAGQTATATKLLGAINDNSIQDPAHLATAYPGATGDLTNLPPKYHNMLQSAMKTNANEVTPPRQQNMVALQGLMKTDPQGFVNTDLSQQDLPANTRQSLMKQQADVAAKIGKAGPNSVSDPVLTKAMGTIQVQSALSSLGITKKDNPQDYDHFAGQLGAIIDQAASEKRPFGSKDLDAAVGQLTATHSSGGLFGFGANTTHGSDIPDDARSKIVEAYGKIGVNNPTEYQIAHRYRQVISRAQ